MIVTMKEAKVVAVIELYNLTKNYGKNRGIRNVSFSIEEEEVFGFIGPNGSGKSTTIRTLLNYIYPLFIYLIALQGS